MVVFSRIFTTFAQEAPFCVMTQSVLENIFSFQAMDHIFDQTAQRQQTRQLMFSTVADLMCDVVLGAQPSVHAAFQAKKEQIPVSIASVYNKINRVELPVSEALVAETAARMEPLVLQLGARPPLVPGYRTRILDGNHLSATEHRIEELRILGAGPLPGKSLVVYDPALGLMTHVIGCEDGHAQERSLLPAILDLVEAGDLWVADRNFATTDFLWNIIDRGGSFLIRQHAANVPWEPAGKRRKRGRTATGTVYEQKIRISNGERSILIRRVSIVLDEPTRDGETEIHLLTNLPVRAASAVRIAMLYRSRWRIEIAFQELTRDLVCEIRTLGYPRAALFGFALAVVAYNVYSVCQAAMRAAHGSVVDESVSHYFLANEVQYAYGGMMIGVPEEDWRRIAAYRPEQLAAHLKELARRMDLARYPKSRRGAKKPLPARSRDKRHPHVSTFRILQQSRK